MNCIKLLLSYLNYKLHERIKKIEIERLKEVRLIRSRLQVSKSIPVFQFATDFLDHIEWVLDGRVVSWRLGGFVVEV